ncbi:MAG: hypothetical protein JSR99_02125 [Proteobacteria bacterium]|nr:hypothetical protein [Pseudomonadota bacterium]
MGTILLRIFFFPGDVVCDLVGLPPDSPHRQVLRSYININAWGAVASGIAIWAFI